MWLAAPPTAPPPKPKPKPKPKLPIKGLPIKFSPFFKSAPKPPVQVVDGETESTSKSKVAKQEAAPPPPAPLPTRTPTTLSETLAFRYLENTPYYGDSDFSVKDDVKRLCTGGSGDATWKSYRYDMENKRWGTNDLWALRRLLTSGIWVPPVAEGNKGVFQALLAEVNARIEDKQQASSDRAVAKSAALRDESMAEIAASSSSSAPAAKNTEQRNEAARARDLESGVLQSTPEELAQLYPLGLTDALVDASLRLEALTEELWHLGPKTGLSPAARILRLLRFKRIEVRANHPEVSFDEEALAPLYAASDQATTTALVAIIRNPESVASKAARHTAIRKKRSATKQAARDLEVLSVTNDDATSGRRRKTTPLPPPPPPPTPTPVKIVSRPFAIRFPAAPVCPVCGSTPMLQFMDCSCVGIPAWVSCLPCGSLVNEVRKPCGHVHADGWVPARPQRLYELDDNDWTG
jgi:hypothetical protein